MTKTSIKTAPPNSLVLITDAQGGLVPDHFPRQRGIIATDSCIAVGCLAQMDGETEITIEPASEVDTSDPPAFDGTLMTPSHVLVVSTVEWNKLLEASVPTGRTRVRIWVNHPSEPNNVTVGFG